MANQITDNRTAVDNADAATPYDNLAGATAGTLDSEIFYQGTGSVGYSTQNTRQGLLFDAGSAQDWSNNHFYLLVNCGIVGLLDREVEHQVEQGIVAQGGVAQGPGSVLGIAGQSVHHAQDHVQHDPAVQRRLHR